MAKILFIVNVHPTESFAMVVAKRVKEILEKQGHEIIWKKIAFENTGLAKALKKDAVGEMKAEQGTITNMSRWVREYKPDIAYDFHSTPHESGSWGDFDYHIAPYSRRGLGNIKLVEVKAVYKKLPERILRHLADWGEYRARTTSRSLTESEGLRPKEFGKAIAREINRDIALKVTEGAKAALLKQRGGNIPRKFPPKPRRRFLGTKRKPKRIPKRRQARL